MRVVDDPEETEAFHQFVEGRALFFPQDAPNDPTRAVADLLAREEAFLKPAAWIQFAAGIEFARLFGCAIGAEDLRARTFSKRLDAETIQHLVPASKPQIPRPQLSEVRPQCFRTHARSIDFGPHFFQQRGTRGSESAIRN